MQNHSMPLSLRELARFGSPVENESEVRWARNVPKTCLVFVHGFGGRAVATWGDFADMAMEHPDFAEVDLVFLGYESCSRTAAYNMGVLYQALQVLAERPLDLMAVVGGPLRPEDFEYESIVLVGHSLGGALVRDVAMSAKIERRLWADKLQLALFAPAHLGANIIGLLQMGFGFLSWLGPLKAGAVALYPVLQDLEAGSTYITRLLSMAQEIGIHCTTKAIFVAHAAGDWVVSQNTFFKDPPPLPYPDSDHVRCCKPIRTAFDRPLLDIARVLQCVRRQII